MTNGEIAKLTELLNRVANNNNVIGDNMATVGKVIVNMSESIDCLTKEVANLRKEVERQRERSSFAQIIERLKQRGVITEADAVRWAEAEVAHA